MVIITPTEMVVVIGFLANPCKVIGFLANPCKWVIIGCKMGKNLAPKKS
jgi:hypothetical protein